MTIGGRIKQIRRENKMTIEALASDLGASSRTVLNWEQGHCGIPFEMAIQICQKFGCTLDWLVGI